MSTAAGIGIASAIAVVAGSAGDTGREQVVAQRGAEVMPFDLDATTHRFQPTVDGGVQAVIADVPSDR